MTEFVLTSGQHVANLLIALLDNNQLGVTTMRSVLDQLHEDNCVDFYEYLEAQGRSEDVMLATARNGLIPFLAPGMESPLTLTEDGKEYAYPERANAFLALAYGSNQDEATAVIASLQPVAERSMVEPLPEFEPQSEPLKTEAVQTEPEKIEIPQFEEKANESSGTETDIGKSE